MPLGLAVETETDGTLRMLASARHESGPQFRTGDSYRLLLIGPSLPLELPSQQATEHGGAGENRLQQEGTRKGLGCKRANDCRAEMERGCPGQDARELRASGNTPGPGDEHEPTKRSDRGRQSDGNRPTEWRVRLGFRPEAPRDQCPKRSPGVGGGGDEACRQEGKGGRAGRRLLSGVIRQHVEPPQRGCHSFTSMKSSALRRRTTSRTRSVISLEVQNHQTCFTRSYWNEMMMRSMSRLRFEVRSSSTATGSPLDNVRTASGIRPLPTRALPSRMALWRRARNSRSVSRMAPLVCVRSCSVRSTRAIACRTSESTRLAGPTSLPARSAPTFVTRKTCGSL